MTRGSYSWGLRACLHQPGVTQSRTRHRKTAPDKENSSDLDDDSKLCGPHSLTAPMEEGNLVTCVSIPHGRNDDFVVRAF